MAVLRYEGDYDDLSLYLRREIRDSIASRRGYDKMLDESDRQYEGRPRVAVKTFPWTGASNLEVPVGATHVDTVVSRLESSYFATLPWVIVRATNANYVLHAQALEDYMNQISLPHSGYRQEKAVDLLAMTKLGTSFQYLTYALDTKRVKNERGFTSIIMHDGPKQVFIHPKHLLVPPDARDVQNARWVGIRSYSTWGEMIYYRNKGLFDSSAIEDVRSKGITIIEEDQAREATQGIRRAPGPRVWQNLKLHCLYQADDDSEPIDLCVDMHYPSGVIYRAIYNPYDHMQWPISKSQYMIRESAFYGIGIMTMLAMIQDEITTIHNYCLDNLLAANTVVALAKKNVITSLDIAPMSFIEYTGKAEDIRFERLGTALSGQQVGEAAANGYAERRTGVSEGNVNRMAAQRGLSSSRTPATTTLALLGESNKRFELAIENSKDADSILLMQHVMLLKQYWSRQRRYADQWDTSKARLLDILFSLDNDTIRRSLVVEVSASTSAVNRDVEKQNMIVLSQYMREFYGLFLTFVRMQAQSPGLQPIVRKIIDGISTFAERLLRTFDIRDPERFILRLDDVGATVATQPEGRGDEFTQAFVTGAPVGAANGAAVR